MHLKLDRLYADTQKPKLPYSTTVLKQEEII